MRMRALAPALVLLAGLGLGAFTLSRALAPGPPARGATAAVHAAVEDVPLSAAIKDFDPREIVSLIPDGAIRAIDRPRLLPAQTVDLRPDELVIGVELGGRARAYPIRVLSAHEVVNDVIAGHPIAVTW